MGEVCRADAGEHIGQVANFLYAKQRIPGYRVEGRPPRSLQWLRFAPPGGFARVWWRRSCAFNRLHLPTREDGGSHLKIYRRVRYEGVCGEKGAEVL